jgi:hypothetical protein
MIAIFAFKKIDSHYKPMNNDFIRLAKLSVKSAKKFYKTKIYCDINSFNFFKENDIFFDDVVIINEFIYDYPSHFSIAKIYAMIKETEPYILLDFDVVLLEKLESTRTITYGYPEINLNDNYINIQALTWLNEAYVKPFNDNVKKYYNNEEITNMNWVIFPSFCVLMVKNPKIMSIIFEKIFKLIDKQDINKMTPTLLEQFLTHQYVIKHNVDFGFIHDKHPSCDNGNGFDKLSLISNKFVHLHINNPIIVDEINYLEEILNK